MTEDHRNRIEETVRAQAILVTRECNRMDMGRPDEVRRMLYDVAEAANSARVHEDTASDAAAVIAHFCKRNGKDGLTFEQVALIALAIREGRSYTIEFVALLPEPGKLDIIPRDEQDRVVLVSYYSGNPDEGAHFDEEATRRLNDIIKNDTVGAWE